MTSCSAVVAQLISNESPSSGEEGYELTSKDRFKYVIRLDN